MASSKSGNLVDRMKHLLSTAKGADDVEKEKCAKNKANLSALQPKVLNRCICQTPIPKLSNVFLAFAQTRLFDFEDFAHRCLLYICQNADELFESDEFLQIDQKLLCEIFDCDHLVISGIRRDCPWNGQLMIGKWATKR
ncbi:hypothetical protein niasHS_011855 [Heterodera schachtii]|uniref:BACK domain-containing protein n=1 Tax=Heterodera schachtii TaxID=97005 RepID=A0ABD2IVC9_HETSC